MFSRSNRYRLALALSIVTALMLIWLSLGVGIIGADGDPANRMYFSVVAVGLVGAVAARLRPGGMAIALVATAIAQAAVGAYALMAGLGRPYSPPLELIALNGFFVALFLGSAWLFHASDAPRGPEAASDRREASI